MQHPEVLEILKKVYVMDHEYKADLEDKFRYYDKSGRGNILKHEFAHVLGQNVRGLTPDDINHLLYIISPPTETQINFDDFMKIVYRYGESMPLIRGQFQESSPSAFAADPAKEPTKSNTLLERIKYAVRGKDLPGALRKAGTNDKLRPAALAQVFLEIGADVSIPEVR